MLSAHVQAQDFEFGQLATDDQLAHKNQVDSVSNAIVLNEYGRAEFYLDDQRGQLNIQYYHHVRIKVFNKDGSRAANIQLPAYKGENSSDFISDIKGMTINFQNGNRMETPLERKNIYEENYSKYLTLTKFTLPNIQDGSIIEYSYRVLIPRIFNFHTWEFQDRIPKVHSQFEAIIPGAYNYNVSLRGPYKITDVKSSLVKEGFSLGGWRMDCSDMLYTMNNVPAFVEEDYMTAPSNFLSAIYFELSDVYTREGAHRGYTQKWKDVDDLLLSDKNFGGQLKRKDAFKDILPAILAGKSEERSKAAAIYEYVRKQIKWNDHSGMYSTGNIEDALKKHSGNDADINLALVAGLSAAGIKSHAVILSTRNNGIPNKLFPVISDFNYVVALAEIEGKQYWLDATEPLMAFGQLPMRCLNDSGRVMEPKKTSYWAAIDPRQKRATHYYLSGELLPSGTLKGEMKISNAGYAAFAKRSEIASFASPEEYVETLMGRLPRTRMIHYSITGMDSTDEDLVETYEVEIPLFDSLHFSRLYFNPFMVGKITKNPFSLSERNYPVDFGMPHEEAITIQVNMPKEFALDSKPQDIRMVLPDRNAGFRSTFKLEDGTLQGSYNMFFNQAIYSPDDYLNLKELYNRVIQLEKTDVIFKKS